MYRHHGFWFIGGVLSLQSIGLLQEALGSQSRGEPEPHLPVGGPDPITGTMNESDPTVVCQLPLRTLRAKLDAD